MTDRNFLFLLFLSLWVAGTLLFCDLHMDWLVSEYAARGAPLPTPELKLAALCLSVVLALVCDLLLVIAFLAGYIIWRAVSLNQRLDIDKNYH